MKSAVVVTITAAFLSTALASTFSESAIVIQSEESKTNRDGAVFNRISFRSEPTRDIWLMQQSHQGLTPEFHKWDRLTIVVDKIKTPYIASYYEMQPGALDLDTEKAHQIQFLVSCFMCHNNGPRVIRPEWTSTEAPLTLSERMRIVYWNFKIRSYGRVDYNDELDHNEIFRMGGHLENEKLEVHACTRCHSESNQGVLTRQNSLTIKFMVERGYMPPRGYKLTEKDRKAINEFVAGF